MEKVYKSKVGRELVVILLLIVVPQIVLSIINPDMLFALLILLPFAAYMVYLFKNTFYYIEGNQLIIRSTFMYKKAVDIKTIRKITETRNPISSPAMSLDRLEIWFNRYDSVIVSPKEKDEFVKHLIGLNPDIVFETRKKS